MARAEAAARAAAASLGTLDTVAARLDPLLDRLTPAPPRTAPPPTATHRLDAQS